MDRATSSYIDDLGAFFGAHGMPPMAGRMLGYLLVCDPPEQSFDALSQACGASRATVSTMTRLLTQLGLVERRPGPARTLLFRLRDDAWTQLLEDDLRSATRLRQLANTGLQLTKSRNAVSRSRLLGMRAFYTFLEQKTESALNAWRSQRR